MRLGGAQLAIGAAPIFARYALEGAAPLAVSATRLVIATIALFALTRRLTPIGRRREIALGCAGLALASHFATWIASLDYVSVAISTLLVTTTPLWTEAFDVVRERRAPSRTFTIALLLGVIGVALVASHDTARPTIAGHVLRGAALALLGSLAIGAYLLVVRDAALDANGTRLPTAQIVTRTYGWAAIALVLAAACAHQGPPAREDGVAWAGILAMAFVSQLLGHTALNASLAWFTPSVVALSTLCEPVVAGAIAAFAFHERIGPPTALGGVFVLAAVAIVLREPPSERNPIAPNSL